MFQDIHKLSTSLLKVYTVGQPPSGPHHAGLRLLGGGVLDVGMPAVVFLRTWYGARALTVGRTMC